MFGLFLKHSAVAFLILQLPLPPSSLFSDISLQCMGVQTARTSLIHTVVLLVSDPQAIMRVCERLNFSNAHLFPAYSSAPVGRWSDALLRL